MTVLWIEGFALGTVVTGLLSVGCMIAAGVLWDRALDARFGLRSLAGSVAFVILLLLVLVGWIITVLLGLLTIYVGLESI